MEYGVCVWLIMSVILDGLWCGYVGLRCSVATKKTRIHTHIYTHVVRTYLGPHRHHHGRVNLPQPVVHPRRARLQPPVGVGGGGGFVRWCGLNGGGMYVCGIE